MTKVSKDLYDEGYRITGQGTQIRVIDEKDNTHLEILFFSKEILIMSADDYVWANKITKIFMDKGEPRIEYCL